MNTAVTHPVGVIFDGAVAEVVINRPDKLNALDDEAMDVLRRAFEGIAGRSGVRAVLLRGEGRAFCVGRDIANVDPAKDDAKAVLRDRVHTILAAIRSVPVPVVAAVQGACLGIGLGLAASADIVYAAADAKFGSPFARLGAVLDSGGHALLVDRLGPQRTMDLIVTAELLDGQEAARVGLVSRVVTKDDLLDVAREQVRKISEGPTATFIRSKKIITMLREQRGYTDDLLDAEAEAQRAVSETTDYIEGFAAFRERREPIFTGH